jgi:hypothetical protein
MQDAYQQPGGKKKTEISPNIERYYSQERLVKKVETILKPPYVVGPPYLEGITEGSLKTPRSSSDPRTTGKK